MTLLFMLLVIGIRLKHGWYGVGYCLVFDVTLHVAGNWDKVKIDWYGVGYCLVFDVTLHVAGNWDKVET